MRYLNIVGHCHSEFPPIGWPACPIQLVRLFSCSSESDRTVLDQGRRNESIRVSMHYQVFAPAQDAETSIDELPGTIEEKNRRFGDAALGLKMGQRHVMRQQSRRQNCRMQL